MRERTVLRRGTRGAPNTRAIAGVLTGACLLGLPGTASAETTIGQTFVPSGDCSTSATLLQSTSPSDQYSAPSPGVITSWSFQAGPDAPQQLKLKVGRAAGGDSFTIVGESAAESPQANALNSFPTRISVQAGDIIGFFISGGDPQCGRIGVPGYSFHFVPGDPPPGTTSTYSQSPPPGREAGIAAILERDCDSDGFGDETQDASPACPRTLTLDASKNKVKKGKKVTLSGQVVETRQGGACAASQPVELYRKRPSQTSFLLVERLQTDPVGNFSAKPKVKKTFEYRAVVPETATCAAQTSNTERIKVKKPK
jgi:hypothetical protein